MVHCNHSLQKGVLPVSQKRSIFVPELRADGLDAVEPTNVRPISNVTFLSKITEKLVAAQLMGEGCKWEKGVNKKASFQPSSQVSARASATQQKLCLSAYSGRIFMGQLIYLRSPFSHYLT